MTLCRLLIAGSAAFGMCAFASSASAAIATPHVAGSHQGWSESSDPMTETSLGSGVFTRSYSGLIPNERYEFKITDGTWNNSYPGPNSWFFADANGDITLTYDTNTYADGWSPATERLGVSNAPLTWTAAGDFQSEVGAAGDWSNNEPLTAMTPLGGGIYQYTATLPAGTYNWKPVVTGSWDSISLDGRNISTANYEFTLADGEFAQLQVNALDGTVRVNVVPEPTGLALLGLGALVGLRRRRGN